MRRVIKSKACAEGSLQIARAVKDVKCEVNGRIRNLHRGVDAESVLPTKQCKEKSGLKP
jgi:hypothetical protein